jgi:hypothetical protein
MTILKYRDWLELYGDDTQDALIAAFEQAVVIVDPTMPQVEAHRLAASFAKIHAGELLKLDGSFSMAAVTRDRVKSLVAQAIANGDSLKALQKNLQDDIVFSRDRAILTARTETAIAHGQGSHEAAVNSGRNMKRWITQGGGCDICEENAGDGDIGIEDDFSSGDATIPAHPNCECNVRYFTGG